MHVQNQYLRVWHNRSMSAAWFCVAIFCFLFGSAPWLLVVLPNLGHLKLGTHWPAALLMLGWSILPWALGAWLLFHATCKTELAVLDGDLVLARSWGPIRRTKRYAAVGTIYLVHRWYHRKNGPDRKTLTIMTRQGRKKKTLVDELITRDLPAIADWVSQHTSIKCLDLRHIKPVF